MLNFLKQQKEMYYEIKEKIRLNHLQMCICYCPEWCTEGFQIGVWDKNSQIFQAVGIKKEYFDQKVLEFCPLNNAGEPVPL